MRRKRFSLYALDACSAPTVFVCVCLCIALFGEKCIIHSLLPSVLMRVYPTEDGTLLRKKLFCSRSEVNTGLGDLLRDMSCDYERK